MLLIVSPLVHDPVGSFFEAVSHVVDGAVSYVLGSSFDIWEKELLQQGRIGVGSIIQLSQERVLNSLSWLAIEPLLESLVELARHVVDGILDHVLVRLGSVPGLLSHFYEVVHRVLEVVVPFGRFEGGSSHRRAVPDPLLLKRGHHLEFNICLLH